MTVTRVFKKALEHFQSKGSDAWCWALVDDGAKTVIYVNTYNGKGPKKWDPKPVNFADEAALAKKLKGYADAQVSDFPVPIPA
jgi:hypothetical protein